MEARLTFGGAGVERRFSSWNLSIASRSGGLSVLLDGSERTREGNDLYEVESRVIDEENRENSKVALVYDQ